MSCLYICLSCYLSIIYIFTKVLIHPSIIPLKNSLSDREEYSYFLNIAPHSIVALFDLKGPLSGRHPSAHFHCHWECQKYVVAQTGCKFSSDMDDTYPCMNILSICFIIHKMPLLKMSIFVLEVKEMILP